MNEIIHLNESDLPKKHKNEHECYEYFKKELIQRGKANQCAASIYEIPPLKAAYPYHYHTKNEEAFFIISGKGILKTPLGEREVSAGDFLFFPANENGAHKLTNTSDKDFLVYLDFDTFNDLDVAFYPDSKKIGIWGGNINQVYKTKDQVEYYEDE